MEDHSKRVTLSAEKTNVPLMKRIVEHAILDEKRQNFIQEFLKRKDDIPKLVTELYNNDKVGIENQLETSDKIVCGIIQNGDDFITNIRSANDRREVERRITEAELRECLLSDLQKDSQLSLIKLEDISKKWNEIENIFDPVEIYKNLESQKARINDLIDQKLTIINECRDELNSADVRYIQDLDKHTNDIHCLVERIDKQVDVAKKTYREHLDMLQKTIEDERKIFQIISTKKWESMYEKRAVNEESRMRREAEKNEHYVNEIRRIQLNHSELIRATKIRLDNDNEVLEIEVQKLKRNITLNSEKLDYNFQVLKKREDENVMVRNQQKRRLSKLVDTILTLKRKLKEAKSTSVFETKKFTADIMKLHGKILDLEQKSNLFSEQNNKKYLTVWDINFEECEKILEQILKIDKILWEQQLCIKWEDPKINIVKREDLESFRSAQNSTLVSVNDSDNKTKALNFYDDDPFQPKTPYNEIIDEKLTKIIFHAIANNSGFLIESKLSHLLSSYSRSDQTIIHLDAVLNALGINKSEEIDLIKNYFLSFIKCKKCGMKLLSVDYMDCIAIENMEDDHEFELKTLDVYNVLTKFMKEHIISLNKMMPKKNIIKRINTQKNIIDPLTAQKDVDKCFKSLDFPDERDKIWNVLTDGLQNYLKVLNEREALEKECEFLRNQNRELNHLLQKFVPESLCHSFSPPK
ncbi:CLUMA_CG020184, isoform A [Clunio marinus]|uniref:CLUMA_CG020184, isoform A n=1 Tax=Clunio marinus TaxID=568069 RepID=A0A1J1J8G4_9DIPT|nr:CLUMA_CG020184, isoform A [Clunio marinus]